MPGRNSYFARQSENSYFAQDNFRIVQIPTLCRTYTTAHHELKVSYHTISPLLEIERLLLPGSFRNVSVGCLFVVNTLENIQIVQSFIEDRLQC